MKPVLFIGNLIALSFHHHIVIDAFIIPKVQQIHDRASSVLCHDFSDVSSSLFMQKGRRQYSFSSSKLHSSSPLTSSTKEEKMVSQFERRVSGMEKFSRLPVWPGSYFLFKKVFFYAFHKISYYCVHVPPFAFNFLFNFKTEYI